MKKYYFILLFCLANNLLEAQCWKEVAAGIDHTIALRPDGSLWAWGFNGSGQLGDGSLENKGIPVQIGIDTNWKTISASGNQSFAIKNDGTLWAWGDDLWGQLGINTYGSIKNVPTKVGSASDWKFISAGRTFSIAIKTNGTLWAWGSNVFGQLGNQSSNSYAPTQIDTMTDWEIVAAGGLHTLAIRTDGTLWAWGFNVWGQLGDGSTTNRYTPTKIGIDNDWKNISSGYDHSLALKNDGTLWGWGDNDLGQIGDNTFVEKNVPIQIGSDTHWKSISTGNSNSLAMKIDGTIWAWGHIIGSFSFGTENTRKIPTQIITDTNWKWHTSGETHSFGMRTDGTLWGWGNNNWRKLGDNTSLDKKEPQIISTPVPSGGVLQAFCFNATVADLKATGTKIKWYSVATGGTPLSSNESLSNGNHYYGTQTIGMCESEIRFEVTVILNLTPTPAPTGEAIQTFCGSTTIANLTTSGSNIKWYSSPSGGTALDKTTKLISHNKYYASQTVNYCESAERLSVTFVLQTTPPPIDIPSPFIVCEDSPVGYLHSNTNWYNTPTGGTKIPINTKIIDGATYYATRLGECGESVTRTEIIIKLRTTPPPKSLLNETWISIAGGPGNSLAVRSDGTLWTWGDEYVGLSQPSYRYSPRQEGTDNTWRSVSTGGYKMLGVRTNGEVFQWDNYHSKESLQKDWLIVTTYGNGTDYHSSAIKVDGTLWAWGNNDLGQLGDGTFVTKINPTKINESSD